MTTYAWARWLPAAMWADPVLNAKTIVVPGFDDRGRPPSQFSFFPSGQVAHHTACMIRVGHDPQSCINHIIAGNTNTPGPISQGLITWTRPGTRWSGGNLDPHVVLIAAGRSNHAGSGIYPWGAPQGNGSSIGWECCGPPDHWPRQLVDFYDRVLAAVARNRSWPVEQITTHWEYARPFGRKIDPSGPFYQQPTLGQLSPWSPALLRGRVFDLISDQGDDMTPVQSRILDTRPGEPPLGGRKTPLNPGETITLTPMVPADAKSVMVNVTALNHHNRGPITVWPGGGRPNVSFMNPNPQIPGPAWGSTLVALDLNRSFKLFHGGGGDIVVDIVAYGRS